MAEHKPSPVTFHEYDIPGLNKVFLYSSLALLLTSGYMIWADYDREWKHYQRDFNRVEVERTRAAVTASEAAIDAGKLTAVDQKIAAATAGVEGQAAEVDRIDDELQSIAGTWYSADQEFKFSRADLDVARFVVEEARKHDHDVEAAETAFKAVDGRVEAARSAFEAVDLQQRELLAQRDAITADAKQASREREALFADRTGLDKKLKKIAPSLAKTFVRDAPLLDFMAPSLKVNQAILPKLHEDVNFMSVPRVDRCHTCHLAIDNKTWVQSDANPLRPEFRAHSNFDTIIGKHPVEEFGCTGCHEGGGRAITFVDTAHTPRDKAQEAAWEEEHHWHELHYWDFKQLPLQYTEANCANCHIQESRIPGADKLNAGRQLVEDLGCHGCHKINRPGYTELRKVGPDLASIRGKVTKDWMYKWVTDPKGFRPATKMPRIWFNSNTDKAVPTMNYPLRNQVEIEGVVRFLMSKGTDYTNLPTPSGSGDATRGQWVVENRGCRACHVVGDGDTSEGRFGAEFGPNLNQVGSKLTVNWMYAWVRDPKSLWADTKMPDLRLTDQESLDAATYLASLKNPGFEQQPLPDLGTAEARAMLETVAKEYLRKETTNAQAEARLAAMDEGARYAYVGNKLIGRQGCFGCHPGIPEFEDAQPIGVELTEWASKLLTQLDFGLYKSDELAHDKQTWLRNKLLDPRIYDTGKVDSKHPQDLLRMPNFQLTEAQVDLIMTAVLGFRRDLVQPAGHRNLTAADQAVEIGRREIRKFNCQGCHVIENNGGGMQKVLEGGEKFAPPVLEASWDMRDGRMGKTQQGAKVQPDWFFGFLKNPTEIRPWLNVRMPTFAMADAEASGIVEYFSRLASEPYPYAHFDRNDLDPTVVTAGQAAFNEYNKVSNPNGIGCEACHLPLEMASKLGYTVNDLAPNLELAKDRLKFAWVKRWLNDPSQIQEGTRMPGFFKSWDEDEKDYLVLRKGADAEIEAIASYLQFYSLKRPAIRTASK